jgi:hypothetical protein
MKNNSSRSIVLFFLFFTIFQVNTPKSYTQETAPTFYVQFDYMKSKTKDYAGLESDLWKPIHDYRIKNHDLMYWGLYSVTFPTGQNREYDYVTITLYTSIEALEAGLTDLEDWVRDVHPDMEISQVERLTREARDLVWSETFEILSQAYAPRRMPGLYVMANRMLVTPGRESAYEKMEKEIYLPAHKIATDKGLRTNWHLLKRFAPRGTEYGYNYMTLDVYEHLRQMVDPLPEEVWHSAHPGKDLNRFFAEIDVTNMRELTRGEVWKLVDYATSSD